MIKVDSKNSPPILDYLRLGLTMGIMKTLRHEIGIIYELYSCIS